MAEQLLEKISSPSKRMRFPHLVLKEIPVRGYERVIEVKDPSVGLHALIALHNTELGPALGGVRIFPYASFDAALEDVSRLSRGMTYKSAVAGVGLGGGKSVIIADPKKDKTPELLMAFGAAVDSLKGLYICAEDVGCTTEDVKWISKTTQFVVGLADDKSSGDPSPFTAWGVFRGIQSVANKLFGSDALVGKKIAIQGLGSVGKKLAEYLFWAGADLIVADINPVVVEECAARYGATAVSVNDILFVECDILAPCAMGGILNDASIPRLRCLAVAGAANNQLGNDTHAELLKNRGILYAPDFVINAGGVLNVTAEIEPLPYSPKISHARIHRIYDTLLSIYAIAEKNQESTQKSALSFAEYRIKYGIGKRSTDPVFHHTQKDS